MKNDTPKSSPDVLKTVNLLRNLNLMPLPIARKSKLTYCKNFTDPAFVSPWEDWENRDLGVGIILSTRYKTVDIDLDEPDIAELAVAHLPHNGWIFGRKSKKGSHHVFVISDETDTSQSQRAIDPRGKGYMDTEKVYNLRLNSYTEEQKKKTAPILEYRGEGCQTVMPGTIHHPSTEKISWVSPNPPTELPAAVDSYDLRRSVRKIGFTVQVAKHGWFEGARHEISLALSGMFVAAKWTLDEAEHWFHAFLNYVNDGSDRKKIITACKDTYKNAETKTRIAGGPRLAEITSCPELVASFRSMFMDVREAIFEDMNDQYAVGVYFSKVCIFDFNVIDDLTVRDFETMSVPDFTTFLSNQKVKLVTRKGETWVPKTKMWMEHPKRRTYRITDFMPGQPPEVNGKLNLWRSWAVKPSNDGSIDRWLDHVDRYICAGDQDLKEWMLAWLADIIQNPMKKPGTAIMMRSGQRTGKNTFVEMMKRVIGARYCREMNSAGQVTNRFNSHFQYALLVFANEANFANANQATTVLKTLITDPDFHMDHKHGHAKTGVNYARVVLASNKLHVIDRDYDDERYTVIDVRNPKDDMEKTERTQHFKNIYYEIENGGPSKLLHYLHQHKYDVDMLRSCYVSEAGRRQTLMSMNPVAQWWAKCLSDGRIRVPDEYIDRIDTENDWPRYIGKTAMEASFRDQHKGNEKISSGEFHQMFYQATGMDQADTIQKRDGRKRYRVLPIPNHEEAIDMLNSKFQGAVEEGVPVTDEDLTGTVERDDEMDEY